jgi:hypothetical protein
MSTGPPLTVQVALDDAAAGEPVLALASALAHALGCELSVVYLEDVAARSAAALSVTQVLPHAGSAWLPLRPDDVEQGFRSQAARLRRITERRAAGQSLRWSLRVQRGSLAEAPALLAGESSLLVLARAPAPGRPAAQRGGSAGRPSLVALAPDAGTPDAPVQRVAAQLAHALGGLLLPWLDAAAQPDVLVMSRHALAPGALVHLRYPLLLVG